MTPAAERRPLLPFAWARAHHLVLLSDGERCEALCRPDTAARALLEARRLADGPMRVSRLAPDAFEKVLVLSYQRDSAEAHRMMADIGNELDLYTLAEELPDTDDLLDSEDDAPIIRLINAMLTEAIKEKASDIHIETYERHLQIRFRVDGVLREILRPQRRLAALLISRIKVMASLDIAEKRVPQDGRMALRIGGRAIDVRVSTLPSSHGERVVLRLLDKNSVNLDLLTLGMPPALLDRVDALIARPHGIILVTGPTGSGKSTTLYAALSRLDARERNIMTIEDPVEYELEVRQLCPHCRQPWQADANTARQMAVPVGARLWQPKGCPECNFIGYRGRTGIHELLLIDDRVRAAIHRGENEITLIQQLGPAWQTLRHAGRDKALAGITSWEEVMRVTEQQTTESV
ncbi:MAG: GspE/PulE family protein [Klebsiella pneumoniae]|nr:GspE/PulE family protein [Klebsiella pneumoniae]